MIAGIVLASLVASSPCSGDMTQSDLNVCWRDQAQAADRDLNKAYAKAMAAAKPLGFSGALVRAETAWIAARDATCSFETSLVEGGSIAPMVDSMCVMRMSQARAERLRMLAETLGDAENTNAPTLDPVNPSVDAELNRIYGLLARRLDAAERKSLLNAQTLWLTYRDKACAVEGGDCLTALEKDRTQELKDGWEGEPYW